MNARERAKTLFRNGCNCSQAVLASQSEALGLSEETAIRLATGFGVGLSHGATCGAVSGAIMVLGLRHGGGGPGGGEAKRTTYAMAQEFMEEFEKRYGTTTCAQILGCDPSTDEGLKQARDKGLFESVCVRVVEHAATLLDEME